MTQLGQISASSRRLPERPRLPTIEEEDESGASKSGGVDVGKVRPITFAAAAFHEYKREQDIMTELVAVEEE